MSGATYSLDDFARHQDAGVPWLEAHGFARCWAGAPSWTRGAMTVQHTGRAWYAYIDFYGRVLGSGRGEEVSAAVGAAGAMAAGTMGPVLDAILSAFETVTMLRWYASTHAKPAGGFRDEVC